MIKIIIYYFSGTGNNLYASRQISDRIPGTVVRPVSDLSDNKVIDASYDWIGFIGPSYYSHIPPFMMDCMRNVQYTAAQKIFTVCACAGNRGMALQDMRQMINDSGKETSLEYMMIQPGSYILSYGAFPRIYQRLTVWLTRHKSTRIARDIVSDRKRRNVRPGLFYRQSDEVRLQKNIAEYGQRGSKFKINDKCVKCGLCAKVCPVSNISLENGKITFGDHCNQCMACIQWCGQHAIFCSPKDIKRKRYHHPEIQLSDMVKNKEHAQN